MGEQVKVGVIGTSWFADATHLPILANYKRAALMAVCGRNRGRAEEMAAKYAVPQVFTDYRQMIDKGDLDAVIVVAPDDMHYEMIMAALDAGLHVLCEKPVALNANHAKEMYAKAEEAGVKHMVNFTWRWLPGNRYLKQRLDNGHLGQMYHGAFRYIAGYGRSSGYSWRFDGDRANGILGDLGSHLIDLARWYMGDIVSVSAHLANLVVRTNENAQPAPPANDAAMLTLSFASGALASLEISAVAHTAERVQEQSVTLYGINGTLETQFRFGMPHYSVRGASSDQESFAELNIPQSLLEGVSDINPFGWMFEQPVGARLFIDCILDDQSAQPSLHDGYKAQQVIDAALLSHESARHIAIS